MSAKISGQVWDLELPAAKRLVLLAMADHADHLGNNVFPSVGLVAWKTGYSVKQTRRIIHSLVSDGLLVAVKKPRGQVVVYRIDLGAGTLKAEYKPEDTSDKMSDTPPILGVPPPIAMSPESSLSEDTKEQKNGAEKIAPDAFEKPSGLEANLPPTPPNSAPPPASPDNFQLLFGGVAEHIFGITSPEELKALDESEGACSRIGMIASWLARKSDRFAVGGSKSKKTIVGFISRPATTPQIALFAGWYKSAHKGASLPRDVGKFVEYWREWASSRQSKRAAEHIESIVSRDRLPLTESERAEMRRVRQQAGV